MNAQDFKNILKARRCVLQMQDALEEIINGNGLEEYRVEANEAKETADRLQEQITALGVRIEEGI